MSEAGADHGPTTRVLPPTHGKLSSRYAMEIEMHMGLNPYVLDTVEFAIEQVQSLMEHKGRSFDPSQGLITFACGDALNERAIADEYLKSRTRRVRDVVSYTEVKHYDNLHFYDITIDDNEWEFFNAIGEAHHIDIFKALARSGDADADTPQASLFIMKGIDFFGTEGNQTPREKQLLHLFRNKLPNFLTDTALVFVRAGSLALKSTPGFTRIHTGDLAVEKESNLDIYLFQRPAALPGKIEKS